MDIGGAYLNSDIKKRIFMRLDKDLAALVVKLRPEYTKYLCPNGTMIVRLKKGLYGLIEAGLLWFENLRDFLLSIGFVQNQYDLCVFNKLFEDEQLTVCIYVDDFKVTCVLDAAIDWLYDKLVAQYERVKMNKGPVHAWVGQTFDYSVSGQVTISMNAFIREALEAWDDVTGYAATPALSDLFEIDESSAPLSKYHCELFHSRVMKLRFAAQRTRPDILVALAFLSTRTSKSTEQDWSKLVRVIRYLRSTPDLGIVLRANEELRLMAYIDAAHGVHSDFKGHTGALMSLGAGPIGVHSTKQKLNTKSSTETEVVGKSDYLSEVIWARNFLIEQGYDTGPAIVYQDNTSSIHMSKLGHSTSSRTRHISIRYFWIKDRITSGEVTEEHRGTDDMLADLLTKPLQGDKFRQLRARVHNMVWTGPRYVRGSALGNDHNPEDGSAGRSRPADG